MFDSKLAQVLARRASMGGGMQAPVEDMQRPPVQGGRIMQPEELQAKFAMMGNMFPGLGSVPEPPQKQPGGFLGGMIGGGMGSIQGGPPEAFAPGGKWGKGGTGSAGVGGGMHGAAGSGMVKPYDGGFNVPKQKMGGGMPQGGPNGFAKQRQ